MNCERTITPTHPSAAQNSSIRHGIRAGPIWLGWIAPRWPVGGGAVVSNHSVAEPSLERDQAVRVEVGAAEPTLRNVASYTARRPGSRSTRYASFRSAIERPPPEPSAPIRPADCRSGWATRAPVPDTPRGSPRPTRPRTLPARRTDSARSLPRGYGDRPTAVSAPAPPAFSIRLRHRPDRGDPCPCGNGARSPSPASPATAWPSPGCSRRAG